MSNPYRDALLDLYTWANEHCSRYQRTADVMHRTRVLLTQPAPPELTDEALLESAAKALGYRSIPSDETCLTAEAGELLAFARAAIAADRSRWA